MPQEKIIDAEFKIEREQIPVTAMVRAEIDTQIATARAYPRDLEKFEESAQGLIERHMAMAKKPDEGLNYAIPRGGKMIQGPNARFAEIAAYSYGNLRISRDLVSEENKYVICESICHDLQTNNAERVRVRRRITNRDGVRFDDDMIGVTTNAGASIARRNAVLVVIPKALWWPLYQRALKLAGGETKKEVNENVKKVLEYFAGLKVSEAQVFSVIGIKNPSQMTPEHIATLRGIASAIANGETTVHAAFKMEEPKRKSAVKKKPKARQEAEASGPISGEQFDQMYNLLPDLKLTMQQCVAIMKKLGHTGSPKQFPVAKFQDLIAALEKARKK